MRLNLVALNFSLACLAFLAFVTLGPMLETRFLPVYSTFKITSVESAPNGSDSTVTVQFYKLRDCSPMGYAWYAGDFGNFTKSLNIAAASTNQPPQLPVGKGTATFTIVGTVITGAEVQSLRAETFSSCHPFWTTRTEVFP